MDGIAPATEAAWGRVYALALPPAASSTWAWMADTHIAADRGAERAGRRPAFALRRVVGEIGTSRAFGTVVNGDLAWSTGEVADYDRFLSIMRPLLSRGPVVLGLGNHDHRGHLLQALSVRQGPDPQRIAAVVDQPPFRLVMLDSLVDSSEIGGELGPSQLRWLDELLAGGPGLRTFVFVHHPGESASVGARDFPALERLVRRRECVKAIVTGHEHEFAVREAVGSQRIGLPATGFPFDPGTPCGWVEARLTERSIALCLRAGSSSRPARERPGQRDAAGSALIRRS